MRARANERRSSGAASWVSPGRVEHNVAVTLAPLSPSATMSNLIEPGENGPEINVHLMGRNALVEFEMLSESYRPDADTWEYEHDCEVSDNTWKLTPR